MKRYYDFTHEGWRFLALDGNDVSLYAYPKNDPRTIAATAFYRRPKTETPTWNGAVGNEQLKWVQNKLKTATNNHERVILLYHFPMHPANTHNLWNANALTELLGRYPLVAV